MAKFATSTSRLFAIADAQQVLTCLDSFWPVLEKFGATAADKKLLVERLMRAIALQDSEDAEEDIPIAQMRPALNEQLGAFRGSASLIVYGQREVNLTAQAELKCKGAFPESDIDLERFWAGMPKAIKKYATQLAHRGFSKDEQEKLVRDMGEFGKAMRARKRRKTAHTKLARERDQVFSDLRWSTQCLRRIGRVALRNSPERTKFDRVAYVATKPLKKAPEPPAGASATQPASGQEGAASQPSAPAAAPVARTLAQA